MHRHVVMGTHMYGLQHMLHSLRGFMDSYHYWHDCACNTGSGGRCLRDTSARAKRHGLCQHDITLHDDACEPVWGCEGVEAYVDCLHVMSSIDFANNDTAAGAICLQAMLLLVTNIRTCQRLSCW